MTSPFKAPFPSSCVLFITIPTFAQYVNTVPADCILLFCTPHALDFSIVWLPFLPKSKGFNITQQIHWAGRATKSEQSEYKNWDCLNCKKTISLLANRPALKPWRPWDLTGNRVACVVFSMQNHFLYVYVLIYSTLHHRKETKKNWNVSVAESAETISTISACSTLSSLPLLNSCWKPSLLHNARAIQVSSKQEVAQAENFLYEPIYWPASTLWAQEVPILCMCVCVCVCCQHSTSSCFLPCLACWCTASWERPHTLLHSTLTDLTHT